MPSSDEKPDSSHITGFSSEINKARKESSQCFFNFFDSKGTVNQVFVKGAWDFAIHIVKPLSQIIFSPHKLTALEVGHGGGRLMASAASYFKHVYGVDIHSENELVEAELKSRGVRNSSLLKSDGCNIPLPNESIDIVYSFIVFQHLEKISIVKNYIDEISRVLSPGGVGILYYGRYRRFSLCTQKQWRFFLDLLSESILHPKGYKEFPAKVNSTNLYISRHHMKKMLATCGLSFHNHLHSYRPDYSSYGGQHGIIFTKPKGNIL